MNDQLTLLRDADQDMGADFSDDGAYRWRLWRWWDWSKGVANFLMLNPSTADETVNDPTVRRCIDFAQRWGMGGLVVTNLFALRSTDPKALYDHPDPVGMGNDVWIVNEALAAEVVVAAWGVHGALRERGRHVASLFIGTGVDVRCLGTTKDGHPRHPLYLPADTKPRPYPELA